MSAAQRAPETTRRGGGSAARWMRVAAGQIGALEDVRKQDGEAAVEGYLESAGFAPEHGEPWCAAYVRWVMEGIGYAASRQLDSQGWLAWGERTAARYGAVAVFADTDAEGRGHVGFYVGESRNCVYVLGANTWLRGRYAPGIGIRAYSKIRLLGYRWPSEARRVRARRRVSGFRLPAPRAAARSRVVALRRSGGRLREQLAQARESAPQALIGVLRQLV